MEYFECHELARLDFDPSIDFAHSAATDDLVHEVGSDLLTGEAADPRCVEGAIEIGAYLVEEGLPPADLDLSALEARHGLERATAADDRDPVRREDHSFAGQAEQERSAWIDRSLRGQERQNHV